MTANPSTIVKSVLDSPVTSLAQIVASVQAHPGLTGKAAIGAVLDDPEGGWGTDWLTGPGDDGAVLQAGGTQVVACGEAILPAFVAADPRGAGFAAVLTNVNDVAAMGAVPLGIVDTIAASETVAREIVAGMRAASALYRVPIVGGHMTVHDGPPSLSAFAVGHTTAPLSVTRAAAGQSLVLAAAVDGVARTDFPFFPAFRERGERCADDVRLLARLADDGTCVAAKDVSMAGVLGSLAMLLECGGLGVAVDLDALPAPAGVPLTWWLTCFPSYAFLLCVPAGREPECLAAFEERGLAAAVVGTLDGTGELAITSGGERATVLRIDDAVVTGLPRTR